MLLSYLQFKFSQIYEKDMDKIYSAMMKAITQYSENNVTSQRTIFSTNELDQRLQLNSRSIVI